MQIQRFSRFPRTFLRISQAYAFTKEYLRAKGVNSQNLFEDKSLNIKWHEGKSCFWELDKLTIGIGQGSKPSDLVHELEHLITDFKILASLKDKSELEIKELLIKAFQKRTQLGLEGPKMIIFEDDKTFSCDLPLFKTKKLRSEIADLLGEFLRVYEGAEPKKLIQNLREGIKIIIARNPEILKDYKFERDAAIAIENYFLSRTCLFRIIFKQLINQSKKISEDALHLREEEKRRTISRDFTYMPELVETPFLEAVRSERATDIFRTIVEVTKLYKSMSRGQISPEEYLEKTGPINTYEAVMATKYPPVQYLGSHSELKTHTAEINFSRQVEKKKKVTKSDLRLPRLNLLIFRRAQKLMHTDMELLEEARNEVEKIRKRRYPDLDFHEVLPKIKHSKELSQTTRNIFHRLEQMAELLRLEGRLKRTRPKEARNKRLFHGVLTEQVLLYLHKGKGFTRYNYNEALIESTKEAIRHNDLVLAQCRIQEALQNQSHNKEIKDLAEEVNSKIKVTKTTTISLKPHSSIKLVEVPYENPVFVNKKLVVCRYDHLPKYIQKELNDQVGYFILDTANSKCKGLRSGDYIRVGNYVGRRFTESSTKDIKDACISRTQDTIFICS